MQTEPIYVILADDDVDDRLFFKEAFEELKMNTKVEVMKDGMELMQHLLKPDIKLPHILFLDLNMPKKSGMECLREIKEKEEFKDIAIAIYSTSASEQDIEQTFVNGANVYIKKPNDFSMLKKILNEVITINWQYHTSGLDRNNFLLSL